MCMSFHIVQWWLQMSSNLLVSQHICTGITVYHLNGYRDHEFGDHHYHTVCWVLSHQLALYRYSVHIYLLLVLLILTVAQITQGQGVIKLDLIWMSVCTEAHSGHIMPPGVKIIQIWPSGGSISYTITTRGYGESSPPQYTFIMTSLAAVKCNSATRGCYELAQRVFIYNNHGKCRLAALFNNSASVICQVIK